MSVRPDLWFAEEWTSLLGSVLEALAGERPQLACHPSSRDELLGSSCEQIREKHGEILWWQQHFPLPGEPSLWIGAPRSTWTQLAERILGAAGVEDDSQSRETYLEILQQSLGELSRSVAARWERKVDSSGSESQAAPDARAFYTVRATYGEQELAPLLLAMTGNPQDPPAAAAPVVESPPPSRTFGLLMGVELPVSVSFGHVKLPLKDVLKLTAGSIIELNRQVDEPVEVIVNNCVIARGEVVVVEGNYGVRIHQIMSRQERLEALP